MARIALAVLLVAPGTLGILVFSYFALVDWAALDQAYLALETAQQQSADLNTVFIRATQQNIHRINLFAEGVWTLLSAIIAAIGLHGICTAPQRSQR